MKLSTRARYGTRMMVELAQHYKKGPIPISEISKRQEISGKYLEQLIIPLKKAKYIKSVRGPKGGHMLAKSPKKITIGEIVKLLEGTVDLTGCIENPKKCNRSKSCLIRSIWVKGAEAMFDELNSTLLSEVIEAREGNH